MMSQGLGGSLWQEGSLRAVCVGGSLKVSVFSWLALPRRRFTGRVCWELSPSLLVARLGEEAVFGNHVLVRA